MSDPNAHEHAHDDQHHCSTEPSALMVELREHVPFSVSAVAIGLIVAGAICILGDAVARMSTARNVDATSSAAGYEHEHQGDDPADGRRIEAHSEDGHGEDAHGPVFARSFFHLFHPAHMLFSAAATAAMFVRYERRLGKAVIVGLIGAVGVCGISDVVMPHMSLLVLGVTMPWHICVWEHPDLVMPFAGVGVFIGIAASSGVSKSTVISHSLHVFSSTMASIFYMVGPLGVVAWIDRIGIVFMFVILAVLVPCCLSDIVFPMLMSRAGRRQYEAEPHAH